VRDEVLQRAVQSKFSFSSAQAIFTAGHLSLKTLVVLDKIRANEEEKTKRTIEEPNLDLITGGYDREFDLFVTQLECLKDKSLIQESPIHGIYKVCQKLTSQALLNIRSSQDGNSPHEFTLQERFSIQALCKFMCVSSTICE